MSNHTGELRLVSDDMVVVDLPSALLLIIFINTKKDRQLQNPQLPEWSIRTNLIGLDENANAGIHVQAD